MLRIRWKQNSSIISARLLRESLSYSRVFGVLSFRFGKDKDGLVIVDDPRKWWKWLILLNRIVSIIGIYCGISVIFDGFSSTLHHAIQCATLGFLLVANFCIIQQQFFRNTQAISLANNMLKLFRQLRTIYSFWCFSYAITYINLIMHFNYLWYLALGVLYSELNILLKNEVNNSSRPNLGQYLDIYKKNHESSILFKRIFNNQLFCNVLFATIHVGDVSNLMIRNLSLRHPWVWASLIKIIIEYQLFCSALERIVEECDETRKIVFEASIAQNTKESNKAVEMFITFLNLNPFSLQLFGLFEICNSFYLKILSDAVNYVIIVVQFIFQTKQMRT